MKPQAPKTNGQTVQDTEWNSPVQENLKIVESTSQIASEGDGYQLSKSAAQYAAVGNYYQETGSTNNYIVNAISPMQGIPNLKAGQKIRFIPTTTNTGASNINVQSTGNISLRNNEGGLLTGGEIQASINAEIEYDGTFWRLSNNNSNLTSLLYPIDRLTVSNDTVSPTVSLNFLSGKCADSNRNFLIVNNTSGFGKNMTVNWSPGSYGGGKPSGISITPNTWYYVFVVSTPAGVADFGIDTNLNATNLLADTTTYGYTKWRRIWAIHTISDSTIRQFTQYNDTCIYKERTQLLAETKWGTPLSETTPYTATLNVPKNIKVTAIIEFSLSGISAVSGCDLRFFNSNQFNRVPSSPNPIGLAGAVSTKDRKGMEFIIPNELGEIIGRINGGVHPTGVVNINTIGYHDFRTL